MISEGIKRFREQKPLLMEQRDYLKSLRWRGGRKDFLSLMREVRNGETTFINTADGTIERVLSTVDVAIYYRKQRKGLLARLFGKEEWYQLRETKQVFYSKGKIQRVDRRRNDFVAEKMMAGEDPLFAAQRGLHEEIPIDIGASRLRFVGSEIVRTAGTTNRRKPIIRRQTEVYQKKKAKPSYPLPTNNTLYHYSVVLRPDEYKRSGYSEDQTRPDTKGVTGKKTFFKWKRVSKPPQLSES